MAEVAGTLGHVPGTSLAAGMTINDALSGIHEATKFGAARFHGLREADATLGDRHSTLKHCLLEESQRSFRLVWCL